jgi:hypothetical protein
MPQETGKPFFNRRLTTGTMPHSQTGKITPSSPLTMMAVRGFFGRSRVMSDWGRNSSKRPERIAPPKRKGSPSSRMLRKAY